MRVMVGHITFSFTIQLTGFFLEYYWNEILSKATLHRFLKRKEKKDKLTRIKLKTSSTDTLTYIRISVSDRNTAWLSGEQTNKSTNKETKKARKPHN